MEYKVLHNVGNRVFHSSFVYDLEPGHWAIVPDFHFTDTIEAFPNEFAAVSEKLEAKILSSEEYVPGSVYSALPGAKKVVEEKAVEDKIEEVVDEQVVEDKVE